MSGHSKWATIKHKKGALDAKRGKIFTRLIKEITIAAKMGGGDPDGNPRLRGAIAAAKAENMPNENIKRAIQRGTGEIEGVSYEEITYEGYGPGGVAIIVDVLTDNKNRAVSEIRHAFSKNGGNLGAEGAVAWMFSTKGVITVPKSAASEEKITEIVLDAGAEDLSDQGESWEILTDPKDFEAVKFGDGNVSASAFNAGQVAVYSGGYGPVKEAVDKGDARVIIKSDELEIPALSVFAARTDVLRDPKKSEALGDFLGRLKNSWTWWAQNVPAVEKIYLEKMKQSPARAKFSAENGRSLFYPLDKELVAREQKIADTLYKSGDIKNQIKVDVEFNPVFDKQAVASH